MKSLKKLTTTAAKVSCLGSTDPREILIFRTLLSVIMAVVIVNLVVG